MFLSHAFHILTLSFEVYAISKGVTGRRVHYVLQKKNVAAFLSSSSAFLREDWGAQRKRRFIESIKCRMKVI